MACLSHERALQAMQTHAAQQSRLEEQHKAALAEQRNTAAQVLEQHKQLVMKEEDDKELGVPFVVTDNSGAVVSTSKTRQTKVHTLSGRSNALPVPTRATRTPGRPTLSAHGMTSTEPLSRCHTVHRQCWCSCADSLWW